jgi:hypothetical protein
VHCAAARARTDSSINLPAQLTVTVKWVPASEDDDEQEKKKKKPPNTWCDHDGNPIPEGELVVTALVRIGQRAYRDCTDAAFACSLWCLSPHPHRVR